MKNLEKFVVAFTTAIVVLKFVMAIGIIWAVISFCLYLFKDIPFNFTSLYIAWASLLLMRIIGGLGIWYALKLKKEGF